MSKRLSNNPKKYQSIVIVGRKGAGKSTLIKKMIKSSNVKKDKRFLISPTAELDNTLLSSFDKENVFLQFDNDIIEHIKELIETDTKEITFKFKHRWVKKKNNNNDIYGYNSKGEDGGEWVEIKSRKNKKPKLPPYLLVCDDCAGSNVLKRNGRMETLFSRHRHYRLNLIVVGHSYKYIPVLMRVNSNKLIFFDQNNAELKKIEEEHSREREKGVFIKKFREETDKRFGTFTIDYYKNPIY